MHLPQILPRTKERKSVFLIYTLASEARYEGLKSSKKSSEALKSSKESS